MWKFGINYIDDNICKIVLIRVVVSTIRCLYFLFALVTLEIIKDFLKYNKCIYLSIIQNIIVIMFFMKNKGEI